VEQGGIRQDVLETRGSCWQTADTGISRAGADQSFVLILLRTKAGL